MAARDGRMCATPGANYGLLLGATPATLASCTRALSLRGALHGLDGSYAPATAAITTSPLHSPRVRAAARASTRAPLLFALRLMRVRSTPVDITRVSSVPKCM